MLHGRKIVVVLPAYFAANTLERTYAEIPRDIVTIGAVLTIERTSLPAFSWLWRNRKRVLEKRREIQRRRRVSDRELARWFR